MKLIEQLSKIGTIGLLKYLNPRTRELLEFFGILERATTKKIAKILLLSLGHEKILKDKKIRNNLIDTFNKSEIKNIAYKIKKKIN